MAKFLLVLLNDIIMSSLNRLAKHPPAATRRSHAGRPKGPRAAGAWTAAALAALLCCAGPAPEAAAQRAPYESSPSLIRVSGLLVFYGTEGPLSFQTLTYRELPPGSLLMGEVKGRGCQHGLSIPLSASLRPTSVSGALGRGGFGKALEAIRKSRPDLDGIVDVKVDSHHFSILGIYRRLCAEITAQGFRAAR